MELNPDDDRLTHRMVLARHLKRLRKKAGLSLREFEAKIGYKYSYLSRVENCHQLPSNELAEALDRFFGTGDLFVDLLKADENAALPDYGLMLRKEQTAVQIQEMTSSVVPGLLQTEEYARQLTFVGYSWDTEAQIDKWVSDRMHRKRMFKREVPPHYWALLDEAVLARPIGGSRVMSAQLDYLLQVMESVYTIVQVIPFNCGGTPLVGGSAMLATFSDGSTIGHVEGVMTGGPMLSSARLLKLARQFGVVRSMALSEERSIGVIRRYLKEYERAY
ncbi:helix-turn-helix transcriptional regulator [Streptomyces sp. 8K308]|uniref:helix-turn-helix domain-containing protein n=1 Tax=Streptomyces sp. 8K308 TaxID=2530388 RepID=UPI0014045D79|nr:helix-turn-helix transcriptional regulator [Streptomyces sp. 8K308]